MKRALIIGGGFAGCAMAHQLALDSEDWNVTLIEAGPVLGAGVRTQWKGGHPFTFGPRHFLTQNQTVYDYLDHFLPLRRCNDHEFLTYVEADQEFWTYPIHEQDIGLMPENQEIWAELEDSSRNPIDTAKNFEEFWTYSIGPTLYNKFINDYSKKMWKIWDNKRIDDFAWSPKGVTLKSGPRAGWDTALSAYPAGPSGYNPYFDLATSRATVFLNQRIGLRHSYKDYDLVVNTISPDNIFDGIFFDRLGYIGRDITTLVLPVEYALPENVYFCYYAGKEPYTRVTEYKKFTRHSDPRSTLISIEYPSMNGRLYPLPFAREKATAEMYFSLMPPNMYSIGRAGSYSYGVDIDDCIAQAMLVVKSVKEGGRTHPVPNPKDLT